MDNEEIQGVKFSEFPSAIPGNSDDVVGLHSGDNARFTIANIVAAVRNGLANIFVPKTDVGSAGGVASLDSTGKVPTSQLPSSTGPEPATATPLMDGTGAVGSSTKYAREDHEHPADTNKQNNITANGILKGDGAGGVSAATPGTDYQAPLTAGTDYATPSQLADKANQVQLAKVIGSPAGVNVLTDEYVIYEGQLYKSRRSFSEGIYPATYLSWLDPITIGGLNDVNKILATTIELPLSTVGSSITQTARLIGQCTTLFGIPSSKILSLSAADAALSPASVMIFGVYADGFYVAATQSCTLNSSVKVRIIYTK